MFHYQDVKNCHAVIYKFTQLGRLRSLKKFMFNNVRGVKEEEEAVYSEPITKLLDSGGQIRLFSICPHARSA
jgi:hypothetical protein